MSGAPTDSADDVSCEISLLRAIILAMSDVAAVLTNLVLIITKSSVQSG
jgi:hypothetical protein